MNSCGVVVASVRHQTRKHPEGMERVLILSDPLRAMGALGEPECRRILAAFDLADERGVPIEWLPVSSGARIAMDSGTENLDWTARVLRRIVEFTRTGGVVHVLVAGTCVGAQSYWNAMATMLLHTRGILVMTPEAAMVLTGKRALEASGSVAAEDERGIGGYDRIMGPNGEAAYLARDLGDAWRILFEHYALTYCRRGESGPRLLATADSDARNVMEAPYPADETGFCSIGEIFDERTNPGRKRPFAVRAVMHATIDHDGGCLERWAGWRDAETAVVLDAHLGGIPCTVIGVESKPMPRSGQIPSDGPDTWSGGTLFPQSSKKVARALRVASGVRPAVVLANLSGFDGSPESMRRAQLELGAEIGRAVVEFEGPIVFVVIGRYHGGAYVVFSKALNPRLQALAVEGSFASVIGGAPAAAVVFPRDVKKRVDADPRVVAARQALDDTPPAKRPRLREKLEALVADVTLEKQAEVAKEFDAIHSVERAVRVGSLDAVIAARELRPAIIQRLRQVLRPQWSMEVGRG
jgi:acetyl-CoA carboxylase carboxyltransferase component